MATLYYLFFFENEINKFDDKREQKKTETKDDNNNQSVLAWLVCQYGMWILRKCFVCFSFFYLVCVLFFFEHFINLKKKDDESTSKTMSFFNNNISVNTKWIRMYNFDFVLDDDDCRSFIHIVCCCRRM